jgi:hypothetical protein
VASSSLHLTIPPDQALWCPDTHAEPLRVSGVQSGNHSGPVGSDRAQQRFRDDLVVREAQPRFEGWLPRAGRVAVRCRMDLSPRSMAAVWLSGFEDDPLDAGELCVVEVFGRSLQEGSAQVGVGVKQLDDPRLVQSFVDPRLPIDVATFHTYAVEWDERSARFLVDDEVVHTSGTAPGYPMQVMVAVFDFPGWSVGDDHRSVPLLEVDWVEGGEA